MESGARRALSLCVPVSYCVTPIKKMCARLFVRAEHCQ